MIVNLCRQPNVATHSAQIGSLRSSAATGLLEARNGPTRRRGGAGAGNPDPRFK